MKSYIEIKSTYDILKAQLERGRLEGKERDTKMVIDAIGYCLDLNPIYNIDDQFPQANFQKVDNKEVK